MAPPMAAMAMWCSVFFVVLCVSNVVFCTSYTREELMSIRGSTPTEFILDLPTRSTDILDILVRGTAVFVQAVRWCRRQRGKRSGALARLRRRGSRTPLPGIFLSNVRSLGNKMDELQLLVARNRDFSSSAVLCFTETWLNDAILDAAVHLEGFQLYRADRDPLLSGKNRGGGVCFYVNEAWCKDITVIYQHCSTAVESLFLNCRPFYSPREFSSFILASVYIPPDAPTQEAQNTLAEQISMVERNFPDSFVVVMGDFNSANLSQELPKYRQQIKCPTREERVLDHCYTTVRNAYRAVSRAALGHSDHNIVHLIPTYRQKLKLSKPIVRSVKLWTSEAKEKTCAWLERAGFDEGYVDWAGAEAGNNIDEYTDTVTSFASYCESVCVPTRTRTHYNNDKPWFTARLRKLRREKEEARKSGDKDRFKEAKYRFSREIKEAKQRFSERLQHQLSDGNTSSVWKGLRQITNYKPRSPQSPDDLRLANDLNTFYCRFEKNPLLSAAAPPSTFPPAPLSISPPAPLSTFPPAPLSVSPPAPLSISTPAPLSISPPAPPSISPPAPPLSISESDVNRLFRRQNPRKAAGPDCVSPSILKHCADQVSPVFTNIFNASLELCHVPACFKSSTIIPVPKKARISGLNDYRPVALTSVVMKVMERLILAHLKAITDPLLDPLQFAYRANRSVDDAVNMALHYVLQHLDSTGSYARILFVDFSSAFNTILPPTLVHRLSQLGVPDSTCRWVMDFLSNRTQRVKLGKSISNSRSTNTGSPQGCVLSPLLFSLYTNSCSSSHDSVKLLKFADDTTLIGLISKGDESAYRWETEHLLAWCRQNNLELNATKTVEMIVDFRKNSAPPSPITLDGSPVAIVDSFRFLGTTISQDLKWELNISSLIKKAQQRMYFLRQLRKFNLPRNMMVQFYTSIIESILTSSIITWFPASKAKDRTKLQKVIRSAERVIGCSLPPLQTLHDSRALKRATKIMADPSHPGHDLFTPLPSGRRLQSIMTKTARHKNSFFPAATSLINKAGA